MNGKDIFLGMRYVDTAFIEEAEFGKFPAELKKEAPRKLLRRPLLIAAVIAMMLLLVGCGIVYVLKMQDLKIGEEMATQQVFNERQEYVGEETVSQQVLTLSGIQGSPSFQAAKEWYDFKQEYDPDHKIQMSVWDEEQSFPEEYQSYQVYTQEMVDKLDEITGKYGLKLAGKSIRGKTVKCLLDYLGVEDILNADSGAKMNMELISYYEGGNFSASFGLRMPEDVWPYEIMGNFNHRRKDCFNDDVYDFTGDWREWNYTTASGQEVLIMRSDDDWRGFYFCDQPDAFISVMIEATREVYSEIDGVVSVEKEPMSDRQMEQVADAIDFGVKPQPGDPAALNGANINAKKLSQTQNGWTIEVKSKETDGVYAKIVLGITAPEGIDLNEEGVQIRSGNQIPWPLNPITEIDESGGSLGWRDEDDGDGLSNTRDIIIEPHYTMKSGIPFGPDTVWELYIENLEGTYPNYETYQDEIRWTAEGTWQFELTFEDGNFGELQFVEEPIVVNAVHGWYANGDDCFLDVTLESLILRSNSLEAQFKEKGGELNSQRENKLTYVVMKDGQKIPMLDLGEIEGGLDLQEVDHILLLDGTKLYPVA